MDVFLETAARDGNEGYLNEIHLQSNGAENGEAAPDERYFLSQTPDGDNIFHLAASQGRYGFIVKALQKIPAVVLLICQNNSHGENPLHLAARVGRLDVVQVLISSYKSHLQNVKDKKIRSTLLSFMVVEEGTDPDPWVAQDLSGNTPLHEALRNGYEEVAMYLLDVEPRLANYVNNAAEGTPYLSAAYGHEHVLKKMLTSDTSYSLSAPAGLTPLHAAIHNCTEGVVRLFLEKHPDLAKKADRRRQNALYYAAVADKEGHVKAILKTEKTCAYQRDENGLSPLLIAASLGQLKAVHAIVLHCPQSVTLCDTNGKTVLHLMKLGSYQEGIELLTIPALKRLINIPDIEGNSPLHIAAGNSDHIMAKVIIDTDNTGINLRNKEGYTPWDLIKVQEELSESMAEIGYQLVMYLGDKQTTNQPHMINQTTLFPDNANERMQKKFSTLGIIAVVLAAVTFAAGFSVPGGFDHTGYAVLTRDTVFKVFMLSNTTAMCGYTFVLFSTLWAMMFAQRDDQPRFLLHFSINILQLSFYATLIAFASSAYALTSARSLWLAIVLVCLPPCAILLTISKSLVFRLSRLFSKIWI